MNATTAPAYTCNIAVEMKALRTKSETFKAAHAATAKAVRLAANKGVTKKYKEVFSVELKAACVFNAKQKASQTERKARAAAFSSRVIFETEKAYKVAVSVKAGIASADGAIWVPKSVIETSTGLPAAWWMDKNWNFMNINF